MRPRQELADDLIVALSASGLIEREIFALSAFGLLEREIVALQASGLLERDVTDTGTKAISFAPRFERSPKRKRGPAVRQITACGAPRGARRVRQRTRSHRFALFGAPPPSGPTSWVWLGKVSKPRMLQRHRGNEGVRLDGRDAATNSIPPPCGEVRRRLLAASGWGSCVAPPLCCLSADAPTPASRVALKQRKR